MLIITNVTMVPAFEVIFDRFVAVKVVYRTR